MRILLSVGLCIGLWSAWGAHPLWKSAWTAREIAATASQLWLAAAALLALTGWVRPRAGLRPVGLAAVVGLVCVCAGVARFQVEPTLVWAALGGLAAVRSPVEVQRDVARLWLLAGGTRACLELAGFGLLEVGMWAPNVERVTRALLPPAAGLLVAVLGFGWLAVLRQVPLGLRDLGRTLSGASLATVLTFAPTLGTSGWLGLRAVGVDLPVVDDLTFEPMPPGRYQVAPASARAELRPGTAVVYRSTQGFSLGAAKLRPTRRTHVSARPGAIPGLMCSHDQHSIDPRDPWTVGELVQACAGGQGCLLVGTLP